MGDSKRSISDKMKDTQKWEYKIFSFKEEFYAGEKYGDDIIEENLNRIGDEGWEAITLKSGTRRIIGGTSEELEAWYRGAFKRLKR